MLGHNEIARTKTMLLAMLLAGGTFVLAAGAQTPPATTSTPSAAPQSTPGSPAPPATAQARGAKPAASATPYRFYPTHFSKRAELYYRVYWGVDSLRVKYAESGEMIRFSYRIVDAERAAPLNDKKLEPSLVDPQARVKLVVPSLEQVGMLRQSSAPEAGKMYWMGFSNKGRKVRPGDHVNVVIGGFRANGLVVE